MKAVRITARGGPEVLELSEVPELSPGHGQAMVRVRASAINRADLLQCLGQYPAPPGAPPDIPGLEYAGEVVALGEGALDLKVGQRVMGIVSGGGFSERLVVHERECVKIPADLDFTEAAAIPEAFLTAFDALVLQGNLRIGTRLLIHAVASGVGTAALQLGSLAGALVIGTSRSQAKLDRCRSELALAHGILCRDNPPRFANEVRAIAGPLGVDLVLDLVGGAYLNETLASMSPRGRLLLVGLLGGPEATVPLRTLLSKRLTLTGTVLRSRAPEEKMSLARAFEEQVLPAFSAGRLKAVVDSVFSVDQIRMAFAKMQRNDSFGKIVVRW